MSDDSAYLPDGSIRPGVSTSICVTCHRAGEVWGNVDGQRCRVQCPDCLGHGIVPLSVILSRPARGVARVNT